MENLLPYIEPEQQPCTTAVLEDYAYQSSPNSNAVGGSK